MLPNTLGLYFILVDNVLTQTHCHICYSTSIQLMELEYELYTCILTNFALVNLYVDLVVFTRMSVLYRPEVVDIAVNTV